MTGRDLSLQLWS